MGKSRRPVANPPHAELEKSQEDTPWWTEAPRTLEQGPVKGSHSLPRESICLTFYPGMYQLVIFNFSFSLLNAGAQEVSGWKRDGSTKGFFEADRQQAKARPGKGISNPKYSSSTPGAHSPEKVLSAKRNSKLLLPTPAGEKAGDEGGRASLPPAQSFREMTPKCGLLEAQQTRRPPQCCFFSL